MKYLSCSETARIWGILKRRVQILCKENRIQGVEKVGRIWLIPSDAKKPSDLRCRSDKRNP